MERAAVVASEFGFDSSLRAVKFAHAGAVCSASIRQDAVNAPRSAREKIRAPLNLNATWYSAAWIGAIRVESKE
jgi:hypothetical protein